MSLKEYRESQTEQERIRELFGLVKSGRLALDIGARDGYISIMLADYFSKVTALDLEKPIINHPSIECIQGNVCSLPFPDSTFDLVLCTEVLEHIPAALLLQACNEITRVAKRDVIIGVPYKQDTRLGRTTCYTCGGKNPPWGHVNTFDEEKIDMIFSRLNTKQISFVGTSSSRTNFLSELLMNFAGNPYGTYSQEECCIHCGSKLKPPPERKLIQKIATRIAVTLNRAQSKFITAQPNWVHVLLSRD